MRIKKTCIIATLLISAIHLYWAVGYANKIAILPFENMSGHFEALEAVMNIVYEHTGEEAELVHEEKVERALLKLQLRHTAYLTTSDASIMSKELGVCAILTGMICLYAEEPYPKAGLIIKVYNAQEVDMPIIWMDSAALDAHKTEGWLGKRKFNEVNQIITYIFQEMLQRIPLDCAKK